MSAAGRVRRRRAERASGLLSATIGVAVVLGLLGLAANVAVGLWSRSTVESVALDAARRIAATHPAERRVAAAPLEVAAARRLLGRYGERVSLTVESVGPDVVLWVRAPGVSLLPRMVGDRLAIGRVDHRIVARAEEDRP